MISANSTLSVWVDPARLAASRSAESALSTCKCHLNISTLLNRYDVKRNRESGSDFPRVDADPNAGDSSEIGSAGIVATI